MVNSMQIKLFILPMCGLKMMEVASHVTHRICNRTNWYLGNIFRTWLKEADTAVEIYVAANFSKI